MIRRIALALAVAAGVACALLLTSGVSTTRAGERVSCSTVVGASELAAGPSSGCHDALVDRTLLATAAGLLCVTAATGWRWASRPQPE